MCTDNDSVGLTPSVESGRAVNRSTSHSHEHDLRETATLLCSVKGDWKRAQVGFIGYGDVPPGSRVLIAATNLHEKILLDEISSALRNAGAKSVDIVLLDWGKDREFDYEDEINWVIRKEHWDSNPRWYDYQQRIINYARENDYDFLIHGRGGPIPQTEFRFEAIPWTTARMFTDESTLYPARLHELINIKTWNRIFKDGRGGRVNLTDPEGTDLEYTLLEKYYETERRGFTANPQLGHLHSHPTPPIITEDNSTGVVAATTSHLARPFPTIQLELEGDKIVKISGGGGYGKAWNRIMEETDEIKYPEFPRKGLFWLWEAAIGTNPKVRRQPDVMMLHSGGTEWERNRSGVIHMGFGTRWRGPSEQWAAENSITYGHLHAHLLFPTLEIKSVRGETIKVIERGHLVALDDPEVRDMAKKYGDADELLSEDWVPKIPGISMEGKYENYQADPASWIKTHG